MYALATLPEQPAGGLSVIDGAAVRDFLEASRSEATKRAYRADWRNFCAWCDSRGLQAMPAAPATVAGYLSHLARAGKSASTIARRTAAIRYAHRLAGEDSPTAAPMVEATAAGIRRRIGTAQQGKAPAVATDIRAMVATLPDSMKGARDRALLLLGFAGAFRRSELVALQLADIDQCPEGLRVTLRRSKTDQEGAGRVIGIPRGSHAATCPVSAVLAWIQRAGIQEGALFRAVSRHGRVGVGLVGEDVARVVKAAARAAGLDPARYSGHSLRAGLATSAAAAGVAERVIMQQTGHKSERMVRKYIRAGNLFRENAAAAVGL